MKKKVLSISIFTLFAIGLASCSSPNARDINAEKIDAEELSIDRDRKELVKTNPEAMVAMADSLMGYTDYASVIDARYILNDEVLGKMKKNLKSDISKVQMKYDQELYNLNKRNLEIKTKVNNHKQQGAKQWDDFKTFTNGQMNELEKSIREFAERAS
jgi:hypothetical protein